MQNNGLRSDPDDEEDFDDRLETVRAKWSMDGAKTLSQAAELLREYATYLEELERDGWQLTQSIDDDYGFIENPDPQTAFPAGLGCR